MTSKNNQNNFTQKENELREMYKTAIKELTEKTDGILQDAATQIKFLRADNKIMRARLEMFDDIRNIFHASKPSQGYSNAVDVVNTIEKHLASK